MQGESLTIYADFMSQPSRAVLSLCYLLNIDFRLVEVRVLKGEIFSEEYQKISPTQSVPTMVHGNLTLYESHSILTYLSDTFSPASDYYPKDLKLRAKIDNYLQWHHLNIRFGCGMYVFNKYAAPKYYGRELEGLSELALEKRLDSFAILESVLSKYPYIAGTNHISIADLSCYSEIVALQWVNQSTTDFPNLHAWMAKIASVPAVKKSHEAFFRLAPRVKL